MTPDRKRRPSRVASDTAHSWARNLRLRNSLAKLVLSMLTLYVQGDGVCYVGVETLAEDTELSPETVRRRLQWLESVGALVRLPQWLDEAGRRNGDGRGRRTSDEIRLMIDTDPEEIEARAAGVFEEENAGQGGAISPIHGTGQSRDEPANDSPRAQSDDAAKISVSPPSSPLPAPSLRTGAESLEHEPEESPQSPPLRQGAGDAAGDTEPIKTGIPYERFTETYGEGSVRPQQARTLWESFTEPERELAINGARGYRAQRLSTKKALIDPERFLRNRDLWNEFASIPTAATIKTVDVDAETDPGKAVIFLHGLAKVPRPRTFERAGKTWVVLSDNPPPAVLALLRSPPEKAWGIIDPGSQEFGAWREFVQTHTGRGLLPQNIIINARYETDKDGKSHFVGNDMREGVKVPAPFPPRVDGSWPEVDKDLQKTG